MLFCRLLATAVKQWVKEKTKNTVDFYIFTYPVRFTIYRIIHDRYRTDHKRFPRLFRWKRIEYSYFIYCSFFRFFIPFSGFIVLPYLIITAYHLLIHWRSFLSNPSNRHIGPCLLSRYFRSTCTRSSVGATFDSSAKQDAANSPLFHIMLWRVFNNRAW